MDENCLELQLQKAQVKHRRHNDEYRCSAHKMLSKKPEHVVFSTVKPNVIQQYYDEVSKVSANASLHVFFIYDANKDIDGYSH